MNTTAEDQTVNHKPGGITWVPMGIDWQWWRMFSLSVAFSLGVAVGLGFGAIFIASVAHAQAVPPAPAAPSSYTFTLTPEATDALYQALERASQVQVLTTGERSPRFDALEAQIRQNVQDQKTAAAKVSEKPKDGPKADKATVETKP